MTRSPVDHEAGRFSAWDALKPEERIEAIKQMLAEGWSHHGIASATRLSIEAVRVIVGQIKAARGASK